MSCNSSYFRLRVPERPPSVVFHFSAVDHGRVAFIRLTCGLREQVVALVPAALSESRYAEAAVSRSSASRLKVVIASSCCRRDPQGDSAFFNSGVARLLHGREPFGKLTFVALRVALPRAIKFQRELRAAQAAFANARSASGVPLRRAGPRPPSPPVGNPPGPARGPPFHASRTFAYGGSSALASSSPCADTASAFFSSASISRRASSKSASNEREAASAASWRCERSSRACSVDERHPLNVASRSRIVSCTPESSRRAP